jgi:hypothetical protein
MPNGTRAQSREVIVQRDAESVGSSEHEVVGRRRAVRLHTHHARAGARPVL